MSSEEELDSTSPEQTSSSHAPASPTKNIYQQLEEIEALVDKGVKPWDIDRYLKEGPDPSGAGIQSTQELKSTVKAIDSFYIYKKKHANEIISDLSTPSESTPQSEQLDREISVIVKDREKKPKDQLIQEVKDFLLLGIKEDDVGLNIQTRLDELVLSGLADEALQAIIQLPEAVDKDSDQTKYDLMGFLTNTLYRIQSKVLLLETAEVLEKQIEIASDDYKDSARDNASYAFILLASNSSSIDEKDKASSYASKSLAISNSIKDPAVRLKCKLFNLGDVLEYLPKEANIMLDSIAGELSKDEDPKEDLKGYYDQLIFMSIKLQRADITSQFLEKVSAIDHSIYDIKSYVEALLEGGNIDEATKQAEQAFSTSKYNEESGGIRQKWIIIGELSEVLIAADRKDLIDRIITATEGDKSLGGIVVRLESLIAFGMYEEAENELNSNSEILSQSDPRIRVAEDENSYVTYQKKLLKELLLNGSNEQIVNIANPRIQSILSNDSLSGTIEQSINQRLDTIKSLPKEDVDQNLVLSLLSIYPHIDGRGTEEILDHLSGLSEKLDLETRQSAVQTLLEKASSLQGEENLNRKGRELEAILAYLRNNPDIGKQFLDEAIDSFFSTCGEGYYALGFSHLIAVIDLSLGLDEDNKNKLRALFSSNELGIYMPEILKSTQVTLESIAMFLESADLEGLDEFVENSGISKQDVLKQIFSIFSQEGDKEKKEEEYRIYKLARLKDKACIDLIRQASGFKRPTDEFELKDQERIMLNIFSRSENPAKALEIIRIISNSRIIDIDWYLLANLLEANTKDTRKFADSLIQMETSSFFIKNIKDPAAPLNFILQPIVNQLLTAEDPSAYFASVEKALNPLVSSDFFKNLLVGPNAPLKFVLQPIVNQLLTAEDPSAYLATLEKAFSSKMEYWQQVYMLSSLQFLKELGKEGSGARVGEITYPISSVPLLDKKATQTGGLLQIEAIDVTRPLMISEMNIEQKRAIANLDNLTDEEVDGLTTIPMKDFKPEYQLAIYAMYLHEVIANSRNEKAKKFTDSVNRQLVESQRAGEPVLPAGTMIHGSSSEHISATLLNGNLCGEALGDSAREDMTPFQADFSLIPEQHAETSFTEVLGSTIADSYGDIFYIVRRDATSYEHGVEHEGPRGVTHALLPIGVPSTEINGIIIKNTDSEVPSAVRLAILNSGFYIPVYNHEGELIFTPEEYDAAVEDLNLAAVSVAVWDMNWRTGEQEGSNEGGYYDVPDGNGGTKKYYVKFDTGEPDKITHIWSETLSDRLYKEFGLPIPETEVVQIEGRFAHASEVVEDHTDGDASKIAPGFIMDCWLSNWDVPFNPKNYITGPDGLAYRIDTGGSLLFRARGGRKDVNSFTEVVTELGAGSSDEDLGSGMRQKYPGLTDEMIREQAMHLVEVFTDEKIDELVDGVRMPKIDRDLLKARLKARRDYIASQVLTEMAVAS